MTHPRFAPEPRGRPAGGALHLPRGWPGPRAPWELDRGFRLRVVSEHVLVVTLGTPAKPVAPRPPEAVLAHSPGPGEESLVVVPAPRGPSADALAEAVALPAREGWEPAAVLVLSDPRQVDHPGSVRRTLARAARTAGVPAAWVLQDMPGGDFRGVPYFTVEQSLRQLARLGRRLARRARWRRLLPW